jgi:hypothetical protein
MKIQVCISQVLKPIIREHNSGPWGNFASKNDQPLGKKASKCPGCPGGGGGGMGNAIIDSR